RDCDAYHSCVGVCKADLAWPGHRTPRHPESDFSPAFSRAGDLPDATIFLPSARCSRASASVIPRAISPEGKDLGLEVPRLGIGQHGAFTTLPGNTMNARHEHKKARRYAGL